MCEICPVCKGKMNMETVETTDGRTLNIGTRVEEGCTAELKNAARDILDYFEDTMSFINQDLADRLNALESSLAE
jgi:hypothetical protein